MRIKRQRRKLRGKYSGNCLSCSAKWSKCWYIASTENQREWETRLSKIVTPGADEVCFQCWDAKIRTSPKRKVQCKAEVVSVDAVHTETFITDNSPSTHATKCVERNKRRALNGAFKFTFHTTSDFSSHLPTDSYGDLENEDLYDFSGEDGDATSTSLYEESIILDEENAVILLSTAFRTIPHQIHDVDIISINSYHEVNDLGDYTEESFADDNSKKRGAYYCGKCGKLKKGHICNIPSPQAEASLLSPFLLSDDTQPQPMFQPRVADGSALAVIAQPVVS